MEGLKKSFLVRGNNIVGSGGTAGKSAYETAVDNGFIGTEDEWLESLEGSDGISPTATVEKVGKVATITITDKNGTTTATIKDGEGSESGETNTIESISVNGVNVPVDENKNVDIKVPSIEGLTKDADLAAVAKSGSYNDLTNTPAIPSVGNGTITVNQNGTKVGEFSTNQSTNTAINLTNTTYDVATSSKLGLVKSGTDITVDSSGNVSVNDDSHNHIISNVDGLQIALDGKAASSHTHDDRYYTESEIDTKLNSKLNTSLKGSANGLAELDANGKVPSSQLPSYVDDVIEGYLSGGKFYKESAHTTEIIGETGKIYIDLITNKTYRWSGSTFVVVSETLALGETSSTAYRGDRGKIAYDHSQKTSGNPHSVTKKDVGLSNVPNVATNDQTPTFTKADSRDLPISGETLSTLFGKILKWLSDLKSVAFTGDYTDLSNQPTNATTSTNGLMSKDDKLIVDRLNRESLSLVPRGTDIGANQNLNTINFIKVGKYYCSTNAIVHTLTNCPTTEAFMMEVFSPLSTTYDNETTSKWVCRLRKITTYTGHMYIQKVISGSTAGTFTYDTWHKMYSELDKPVNTWIAFKGATATSNGTAGYVPAPTMGNQDKFFRADGTWATLSLTWNE